VPATLGEWLILELVRGLLFPRGGLCDSEPEKDFESGFARRLHMEGRWPERGLDRRVGAVGRIQGMREMDGVQNSGLWDADFA
jgi:hypothetical protein